jgi:hypothetical protein
LSTSALVSKILDEYLDSQQYEPQERSSSKK